MTYIKGIYIRQCNVIARIKNDPMLIEQLRVTSWWKSKSAQYAVKDKTGNSPKTMGQTNKYEGLYLMLVNHGKRMEYTISLQ